MIRSAGSVLWVAVLTLTGCSAAQIDEPETRTQDIVRRAPVAAPPVTTPRLPPMQRVTLDNGAVLQLAVKADVPLVALSASVRGGAVADPANRAGLAAMTAALLEKGAGSRDARALADAVADVGGVLAAGAGRESARISAGFLAQDTELMLELVLDMLMAPAFTEEEFERARTRSIESLKAARDGDPRSLIGRYGQAFLFGDHPYGNAVSGTETSLAALSRDDVLAHYRSHYGPERLVITVVGDIDPAKVRATLTRRLSGWREAGQPAPTIPAPRVTSSGQVLLIDKPGATQSYFWMGAPGVARNDDREAAIDVANTLFGGRFTSLLNTALRVESGLTYGAGSRLSRLSQPGSVAIVSFTATADTRAAMDLALDVLDRFKEGDIEPALLASARTYLRGQSPLDFETASQVAGTLTSLAFYGQSVDAVDGYDAAVAGVDADALNAVIKSVYPDRTGLTTVVIGDAKAIREDVARYGEVTVMPITAPAFRPGNARPNGAWD
ncbi:MAG: pitrilysin family protein [Pseudomonadota bacterium]